MQRQTAPRGKISPAAPPPFRAQRQKVGMGPQGVAGSQKPFMPQRSPTMSGQMMADGGIGTPDPIGYDDPNAGMQQEPDGDEQQPQQQGGGDVPVISPEAVNYHDDPHSCQGCQYYGQDGNCAVLQMQVSPQGGCTAFQSNGQQQGEEDQYDGSGEPGADMGDTSMGTSGGNQ